MKESKDIRDRETEEASESMAEVIPPDDIVAFNEARSCADLFRLFAQQQLDVAPGFQRKVVWSNKDQTLFIDSLIKQLPIPSLCISLDAKSQKRVVIDGLQRMHTIIRFLNYKIEDWRLSLCKDVDKRISGRKVSEIYEQEPDLFNRMENLTIPITVLRCDYSKPSHMDYLFQIFRRLNSGGRRLLNQEIRNCIYQGAFNTYLKQIVRDAVWMKTMGVTLSQVENARYGNEERVLRFFAMESDWQGYTGNLAQFLNDYMKANRNVSDSVLNRKDQVLKSTLGIIVKMEIPKDVLRNKNLMEGIMVGIAKNMELLSREDAPSLRRRYAILKKTAPYSVDVKEGMAHTDKVKDRIRQAISVFGAQ